MTKFEHDLWVTASREVCPFCDASFCVGREECEAVSEWMEERKEEAEDDEP